MEDNKEPQTQSNPIPVMDIQPARPVQAEQPAPTPAPVGPSVPEQPTVPAPVNEATPGEDTPHSAGAPVLAARQPEHHRVPVFAVVCAVLVAGVFATLAVMVYLSGSKTDQATNSTQQTTNNTQPETATPADVSDTEKAIDESLSGVDDADYDESNVSDSTLGL